MTVIHDGLTVDWLGYATTRLEGESIVIYTDPGRYGVLTGEWDEEYALKDHPSGDPYDASDGDLVVVTHNHHYDADGVRRVASKNATVLVYEGVSAEDIAENSGQDVVEPEELPYDVQRVEYGDELTVAGVNVEVIPAYNREDGPRADEDGNVTHPWGLGCGFVFSIDGTACFWTGDSDAIEEHHELDVSLLMPSIARNFTMDRYEAAELANNLQPDLVVPIHYNTFNDLRAESRKFAGDVASRSIPVALDEGGDQLK